MKAFIATIDEKARSWLDEHLWLLDHYRLPEAVAAYLYKCGYLAGLEAGRSELMQCLKEFFSDANLKQGESNSPQNQTRGGQEDQPREQTKRNP